MCRWRLLPNEVDRRGGGEVVERCVGAVLIPSVFLAFSTGENGAGWLVNLWHDCDVKCIKNISSGMNTGMKYNPLIS